MAAILRAIPFDAQEVIDPITGVASYDRTTNSADFALMMGQYFTNGIISSDSLVLGLQLKVTTPSGLISSITTGGVAINGRFGWLETAQNLQHDIGDATHPRIDRVVVELDTTKEGRKIEVKIKKGTPAASPAPPDLTRTTDVYQLSLAQVRVNSNQALIASVTDERNNPAVCGQSKALYMEQFDDENNLLKYNRTVTATDSYGNITEVQFKRPADNSLFLKRVYTVLDGGGRYTVCTETYYLTNGTTVYKTITYTFTYTSRGEIATVVRVVS